MTWTIENSQAAGWHVIIGDNGSGKSTFLRSIALALELIRKAGFGYHRSLSQ
jgi:ABC-type cobalamin/Fe3+-siderophores transport system ATPase subunit